MFMQEEDEDTKETFLTIKSSLESSFPLPKPVRSASSSASSSSFLSIIETTVPLTIVAAIAKRQQRILSTSGDARARAFHSRARGGEDQVEGEGRKGG